MSSAALKHSLAISENIKNLQLPYDSSVPLLGIYSREIETSAYPNTYI